MRNCYRRINICIAFVLMSALSTLAQSGRMDIQSSDNLQLLGDQAPVLLTAMLDESPVRESTSSESDLPDAPSATTSDASNAGSSTPSPGVKNESRNGAPPAAVGGPLGVDRSVADRHYFLFTGAMFGSSVVNAELTLRCLNKHASCNDVPRALQSRAALYGIGIPADLAISYLTYYMKRKHSHIWYAPSALVTGANVFLGVRAYRWTQQ